MLRVLAAYLGGDQQACSMVRVPTPEAEDAKRPHREREQLVQERLRIENRIERCCHPGHPEETLTAFVGARPCRPAHR